MSGRTGLSPLGQQVFEMALKQVRQFDQSVLDIEAAANAEHGLLRIVSVPSIAALVFPGVCLTHMTQTYPGLKVELRDTDTQQVLDALVEGKADIGIASGQHALNGVRAIPLFQDRFGLVCAADHPLLSRSGPLWQKDLAGFPLSAMRCVTRYSLRNFWRPLRRPTSLCRTRIP